MVVLEAMPHQVATHITSALIPPPLLPSSALPLPLTSQTHNARLPPLPTIGIGAGPGTSGQVLVQDDILGFWGGQKPKFVRRFLPSASTMSSLLMSETAVAASPSKGSEVPQLPPLPLRDISLGSLALEAAKSYVDAVHSGTFPSVELGEVYPMEAKEWQGYLDLVQAER